MAWPDWMPSGAVLLTASPFVLHGLDKLFDRFELLGHHSLRTRIRKDPREAVSGIAENDAVFDSIGTYFSFARNAHSIVSMILFCVISLLVFIIEEPTRQLWLIPFLFTFILVVFAGIFGYKVSRDAFNLGTVDPTRYFRWVAYSCLIVTIAAEISLKIIAEHHAEISCECGPKPEQVQPKT